MLDLGAVGKGYAVGRAAEILQEIGVASALIHGGTSTVYAIGHPPDSEYWKVALEHPPGTTAVADAWPGAIELRDEAMSVSAVWGKCFMAGGKMLGHVIDPRSGEPVNRALLTVVVLPSATETDALSTALLVLGAEEHDAIAKLRPGLKSVLITDANGKFRTETHGSING
jgi:thiamine biosynthesis lipoprotein